MRNKGDERKELRPEVTKGVKAFYLFLSFLRAGDIPLSSLLAPFFSNFSLLLSCHWIFGIEDIL